MGAQYWSWILTGIGVTGLLVAANVPKLGWCINLGAQGIWFWYALDTRQYGFLVSCLAYGIAYIRLLRRAFRD